MCGTAEFLAPEIINFEDISFLTDMWAVGVICYILMSGYSPFLGDTDGDTYNNIARSGTANTFPISTQYQIQLGRASLNPPRLVLKVGVTLSLPTQLY